MAIVPWLLALGAVVAYKAMMTDSPNQDTGGTPPPNPQQPPRPFPPAGLPPGTFPTSFPSPGVPGAGPVSPATFPTSTPPFSPPIPGVTPVNVPGVIPAVIPGVIPGVPAVVTDVPGVIPGVTPVSGGAPSPSTVVLTGATPATPATIGPMPQLPPIPAAGRNMTQTHKSGQQKLLNWLNANRFLGLGSETQYLPALNGKAYSPADIDGKIGPRTQAVTWLFQRWTNQSFHVQPPLTEDGLFGPETYKQLALY